jgi:hypothetical protein
VLERRCLEHVAQPDPADDCTLDHRATDGHDTAGRPALTMFNAPSSYTCLTQDPTQAQVTLGWSAPSATQVVVTLDGTPPPRGIRAALPYEVPAGPATGPGVTIVFACGTAPHTIELRWQRQHSAATVRDVSVVSAP